MPIRFPGGDLNDRFGPNSNVGGAVYLKTKSNWLFGGDVSFLFGGDVEETGGLELVATQDGGFLNRFGEFGDVVVLQRGFSFSARIGKLFPLFGPNPNSGIMITAGVGLLQHNLRIQDNANNIPQLADDYKKGYDQLTNGLALSQFVGYRYLGNKRLINFFAGIDLTQAFTQNRRDYNFATMTQDDTERLDILYGIRVGWTLPLYKKAPQEFYYD